MYRSLFPRDIFAELDRLQREINSSLDFSPSIRGIGRGGFPAINLGSTPTSVEVYAFTPGVDPASLEINVERGVLTISGERQSALPGNDDGNGKANGQNTLHLNERFTGRFRRVVSLPDDVDPAAISAECRDGVLHVSAKRRESAQPRRIEVH